MTLSDKRKPNPLIMLNGIFAGKASSSRYTQLSDLDESFVPPPDGMVLDFHRSLVLCRLLMKDASLTLM